MHNSKIKFHSRYFILFIQHILHKTMGTIHHLLQQRVQESKGTFDIIAFKGFANTQIKSIAHEFGFINRFEEVLEHDRIDLNKIEKASKQFIKDITAATAEAPVAVLYESLIGLAQTNPLVDIPKKILIIENNFMEDYLNQSIQEAEDFEVLIEQGDEIPENDIFHQYYSKATRQAGLLFLQYIDGMLQDAENIQFLFLIDVPADASLSFLSKTTDFDETKCLKFLPNSNDYLKFKLSVLLSEAMTFDTIIVDEVTRQSNEAKTELLKLKAFLDSCQISMNFILVDKQISTTNRPELDELLKIHWHSSVFRTLDVYAEPGVNNDIISLNQGAIAETIIQQFEQGKSGQLIKDIFLTAPTGAGKSLLFQLPAIYLAKHHNAVTVVVSPLIALMKDQVNALKEERDFQKVAYINSELSLIDRQEVIDQIHNGEIDMLYLSPELLLSYQLGMFIGKRDLGLLVIDEAHLVTTWGRDFRVDYWYLGYYIKNLRKYNETYRFPVLALTATAVYGGPNDMVFDTLDSLSMQNAIMYIGMVKRTNIEFAISPFVTETYHEKEKIDQTVIRIGEFVKSEQKTIVYCPWTNQLSYIMDKLDANTKPNTACYFGGLDKDGKNQSYFNFKDNKTNVMVATKAFGMGVDIDDITLIYHHAPSGHLADYVQEIGRAARKTDIVGTAMMDYDIKDLKFTRILYSMSSIKQYQLHSVLKKISRIQEIKKKKNFMVSVEDFQHIFNYENVDIEQKAKSSLLLLEKDLLKKYRFNVMLAKPRTLFTTVFARVNFDENTKFLKKYANFASKIPHAKTEAKQQYVYAIELDKIWRKFHADKNFNLIKKGYFDKSLFQQDGFNISPQIRIIFNFNEDATTTFKNLLERFGVVERALSSFGDSYFDKKTFAKVLQKDGITAKAAKRISDMIISMYSSIYDTHSKQHGFEKPDCFIQQKRAGMGYKFRIFDRPFRQIKTEIRNRFDRLFGKMGAGFRSSTMFLPAIDEKHLNIGIIKLAYILEAFDLGSYEISGGEKPGIFIRVNDPLKLKQLANGTYSNDIVREIDRRQQTSMAIMEYFFLQPLSTPERWDFIERYFLGTPVAELIGENIEITDSDDVEEEA